MKIPIIKYSALEYWLDGTDRYYYYAPKLETLPSNFDFKIDETFAKNLSKEYNLTLPLNFMVPENHKRNHKECFELYRWIKNIPKNSFLRLLDRGNDDESIYVSCPELTFYLAANMFSLAETVMIGNMLCAEYVFDNDCVLKQRNRQPVTTSNKIKRYLGKMDAIKGARKALDAARYISDNCNSPREVVLATMAVLPIKDGGYGMPIFEMNGKVHIKNEYVKGLGRANLRCDIVWPKEKVVAEYESNMTHLEKEQHKYDKKRMTALIGSGYKVIYITNDDIKLFSRTDETFFALRKSLHQRRREEEFQKHLDKRYDVYNILFRRNFFTSLCDEKYLSEKTIL